MKGRDWGRIVEKDSRDCATIASIFFSDKTLVRAQEVAGVDLS